MGLQTWKDTTGELFSLPAGAGEWETLGKAVHFKLGESFMKESLKPAGQAGWEILVTRGVWAEPQEWELRAVQCLSHWHGVDLLPWSSLNLCFLTCPSGTASSLSRAGKQFWPKHLDSFPRATARANPHLQPVLWQLQLCFQHLPWWSQTQCRLWQEERK